MATLMGLLIECKKERYISKMKIIPIILNYQTANQFFERIFSSIALPDSVSRLAQ